MDFSRNQKLALLAAVGAAVLACGLWGRGRDGSRPPKEALKVTQSAGDREDVQILTPQIDPSSPDSEDPGSTSVTVHVAGEVKSPGVYTLPIGSRVIDAVKKAGGTTMAGDLDSLNLAAPLKDGEKVTVPPHPLNGLVFAPPARTGGAPVSVPPPLPSPPLSIPISPSSTSSGTSGGKLKNPGDGTVNINTADLTELQRLPGVGPSTAQKIIDYRNQIGRFSLPDQLMDVKGIGPKRFQNMKPFVVL